MDTLTVSPATYAAAFSKCKPGEPVSGTFSGTFGEPNPDGSYAIELDSVTKDEAEPAEEPEMEMPEGASPAAKAVMSRGGN